MVFTSIDTYEYIIKLEPNLVFSCSGAEYVEHCSNFEFELCIILYTF